MTNHSPCAENKLSKPFSPVFTKADKKNRTVLIPNLSRSFSVLTAAAFRRSGFSAQALPLANSQAQQLGKRYVHNDICFPAQINIGELLAFLADRTIEPQHVAIALAKNCRDCRAGQYSALARKALDDAGYKDVAIITTGNDTKGMHPGFTNDLLFTIRLLWGIVLGDALDSMVLRLRPYEKKEGEVDRLYEEHLEKIAAAFEKSTGKAFGALKAAVASLNKVDICDSPRKPRVFIIGEILMNYHESANRQIVRYLEKHGMEAMLPDMVTFFWRDIIAWRDAAHRKLVRFPIVTRIKAEVYNCVYAFAVRKMQSVLRGFRFYEQHTDVETLANHIDGFIDKTIIAGEGWLIPAEIIHHAKRDVSSFVIIQPFGCLPNQITGRGVIKTLKELFPHISILALDYDYDVSMANLENRLQMLVMAAKGYQL